MIKFISYDGKWPTLCMGTLVVEKDGKQYSMKYVLESGGSCGFNKDYSESYIYKDKWSVCKNDLPKELQNDVDVKEITELVNENIPYGCCGGCL